MVSEHAMLILMLLLAVAVVLLAAALTIYSSRMGKMTDRLKRIEERIEDRGTVPVRNDSN